MKPSDYASQAWKPDQMIAMSPTPGGKGSEPILPGSGIRGPLRHALLAYWRANGGTDGHLDRLLGRFTGNQPESAAWLVKDAYLVDGTEWQGVLLQRHAEDEFSQGVYVDSKFDRVVLSKAQFETRIVLEAPSCDDLRVFQSQLEIAFELARLQLVGLGGGRSAGYGYVAWTIERRSGQQHLAIGSAETNIVQTTG